MDGAVTADARSLDRLNLKVPSFDLAPIGASGSGKGLLFAPIIQSDAEFYFIIITIGLKLSDRDLVGPFRRL